MAKMVGKQKDIAGLLNALIHVDLDAIEADGVAIERLEDDADQAQLGEFRSDHERHVRELQPLVTELGAEPVTKADFKRVLTKGKVVLAALVGDRLILTAMKTNAYDTNLAYDQALGRDDLPAHVRELLLRNRDDERRHLAYIEKRLAQYELTEPGEAEPPSRAAGAQASEIDVAQAGKVPSAR